MELSVREIQIEDIDPLLNYWFTSTPEHLIGMGADPKKLPPRDVFRKNLEQQIGQSYPEKKSYALIWWNENQPIGHSNVNDIIFGKSAFMHLHSWYPKNRKKGMGAQLLRNTLPYYFKNLELEVLYCQPYALNPAPNRTLPKLGFEFLKKYSCIPGYLNFEQEVNLYQLTKERFEQLHLNGE